MENGIYIKKKEVPKGLRGKVEKYEIRCMFKKHPNLTETRDTCRNCKKQNPKTEIVVPSGRTQYEDSQDFYKCGIPIKLTIKLEKGIPQLTQNISYKGSASSTIEIKGQDMHFYDNAKSHCKWGL